MSVSVPFVQQRPVTRRTILIGRLIWLVLAICLAWGALFVTQHLFPVRAARLAVWLHPSRARSHFDLAEALWQENSWADASAAANVAVPEYKEASRLDTGWSEPHYMLGYVYAALKDNGAAISELRVASRLRPSLVDINRKLGELLATTGHLTEAISDYREYLKGKPDDIEAALALGDALHKSGDTEGERGAYRRSLKDNQFRMWR